MHHTPTLGAVRVCTTNHLTFISSKAVLAVAIVVAEERSQRLLLVRDLGRAADLHQVDTALESLGVHNMRWRGLIN